MQPAEHKGAPGKPSPADLAFTHPRPPLGSFTTRMIQKQNPRVVLEGSCDADPSRSLPVASALGIRLGATPGGPIYPNIQPRITVSKPDISTLLGLGHFYFALTGWGNACQRFLEMSPSYVQ
jgi:hypothetical protein